MPDKVVSMTLPVPVRLKLTAVAAKKLLASFSSAFCALCATRGPANVIEISSVSSLPPGPRSIVHPEATCSVAGGRNPPTILDWMVQDDNMTRALLALEAQIGSRHEVACEGGRNSE